MLAAPLHRGREHVLGFGHFPSQVVDVEQQRRVREGGAEFIPDFLLPSGFEMGGNIGILGEEAAFVRDAQMIEHGLDHIEMRDQDGLGNIGGKVVVMFAEAGEEAGGGLAQGLRIELVEIETGLDAFEDLVGFQAPERNGAQELLEVVFAQAKKDVAELHQDSL